MVSTCAQFTVENNHVVKEFPKLGECWWTEKETDTDTFDMECYTPEDVERGEVMYLVECGHVFRTSNFLKNFPDPYIKMMAGHLVDGDGDHGWGIQTIPACPLCRRDIPISHVRLLPREAFRKQFYSVWYATQTAGKKAKMEAEWQSNQRALARYGLQTNTPDDMTNIIFPPNAIPPLREAGEAKKKAAAAAEARKKAAAAAAAGGALLGLFTTHGLYRHMVRSMR